MWRGVVYWYDNMAAAARDLQCTSSPSPSAQLTALAEQLVECARQIMDPYCPAERRQQYQKVMIKRVCSLHVALPHPVHACMHATHCLFICLYLSLAFYCLISSMPLFVHHTSVCTYLLLFCV